MSDLYGMRSGLKRLHVTVFTDCLDADAQSRLMTAMHVTAGADSVGFVPVPFVSTPPAEHENPELGAAMTLVNNLYAALPPEGEEALADVVFAGNAAPRGETFGEHDNGRPFFWANVGTGDQKVLVVMTLAPRLLAVAHRLGLLDELNLIDTDEFLDWAVSSYGLTLEAAGRMKRTQYRGAELLPYLLRRVRIHRLHSDRLPYTTKSAREVLGLPMSARGVVAQVDNFGNLVTDVQPHEIEFRPGSKLMLANGEKVTCHDQLDKVDEGQLALVIGSAGFGDQRFVTVVVKGGSAQRRLVYEPGDRIIDPSWLN